MAAPDVPGLALSQVSGVGEESQGDRPISSSDDVGTCLEREVLVLAAPPPVKQLKPGDALSTCTSRQSFVLNVGKGTQDLKWLATVAAQRFDRMARPNGRMRQRETIRAGAGKCRVVLPAEVRTPRSSPRPGLNEAESGWPYDFVHPKTRIRDVLRNGDHVEITVDQTATAVLHQLLQKEKAWTRVEDSAFRTMRFEQ